MKNTIILTAMVFLLYVVPVNAQEDCLYGCYNNDCFVLIEQTCSGWEMEIYCDGATIPQEYSGDGMYSGTICGGMPNPCLGMAC